MQVRVSDVNFTLYPSGDKREKIYSGVNINIQDEKPKLEWIPVSYQTIINQSINQLLRCCAGAAFGSTQPFSATVANEVGRAQRNTRFWARNIFRRRQKKSCAFFAAGKGARFFFPIPHVIFACLGCFFLNRSNCRRNFSYLVFRRMYVRA